MWVRHGCAGRHLVGAWTATRAGHRRTVRRSCSGFVAPTVVRVQLRRVGWIGFVVSAVLFGIAGIRAGDWLVVAASAVFGAACILFLMADS